MNSIFYIIRNNNMYQLRLTANNFCVCCSSNVSTCFDTAEKYLKKYKSEHGILKALNQMTYGYKVPDKVADLLNDLSKDCTLYEEELKVIEKECEVFNKNNTPMNRIRRILKRMSSMRSESVEVERPVVKKTEVEKTTVKRPVVFKRIVVTQ